MRLIIGGYNAYKIVFIYMFLAYFSIMQSAWNNVEQATHNAVVKIFVAQKKINWFYPYNVIFGANEGTGFFIDANGYIVTCAHVVADANAVFIGMPSMGKQRLKA